jgi:hypothetical protein
MYWLEGLLELLGEEAAGRLVELLARKAGSKRNPAAWFNWAASRSWTLLASDEEVRWVHRGARAHQDAPDRTGSVQSLGGVLGELWTQLTGVPSL